ncbi:hypothetical protein D3C85_1572840 [compost metagenome]
MAGQLAQAPALDAQALMQQRLAGQLQLQAAVQRAVLEALAHHRATEAQAFPGQQARAGRQVEAAF